MNKSDVIFRETVEELVIKVMNKVNAETEYLCAAVIRQTGLLPTELEICQQYTTEGVRIWVQKRLDK